MKSRQHVAAAALRQMRIAGRIHKNFALAPANERLVSFQHDPAIAKTARNFAQRARTVRLHLLRGRVQHPRRLAGMRRDDADGIAGRRLLRQPVQRARVHDHRQLRIAPEPPDDRLDIWSAKSSAASPGPIKTALAVFEQFNLRRPHVHHHGLQLRRDGVINIFLREQRDQAGLGALRRAGRQHRRAVKTKTARDNRQMPERALVTGHRAARRKIFKIVRQRPVQLARVRTRNQANVSGDFEPPDKRPRVVREQPGFRRADGQRDRGFNRRAGRCGVAGVGVQAGRHVHGQTGIFDSLTAAMNFFQPSSSGRFKPMPNRPSIIKAGQASRLSPSETEMSETGGTPVLR